MYMNIQLCTEAKYCFESATKLFKEMKELMIWERLIKWKDETIDVLNKHLMEYKMN